MATFKDNIGREWSIRFDRAMIQDVRDRTGVDFSQQAKQNAFEQLTAEASGKLLIRVLWIFCQYQAAAVGVSPEDFGKAMVGATEVAADALIKGYLEHLPRRQRRELRRRAENLGA